MDDRAKAIDNPILLDNTVLTNFALVGKPDLVTHLWPTACTTSDVLKEYEVGVIDRDLPPDAWAVLPVITPTDEEIAFAADLSAKLGAGERTCLAIVAYRDGLLVSDDLKARHVADQQGVSKTGTIGILVLCVRKSYLSLGQAESLLKEMIAKGYRSPVTDLGGLINV